MSYKKLNNLIGWVVFAIASLVFILTSEPTASFWDCGEYIATAYKLQVGHPPGAPLFQMLGRFFTLFAFGDTSEVARMMNTMSALASGFTVLFLFWIITYFARKVVQNYYKTAVDNAHMILIFGSGLVGALAFTFMDSFWFSAVEGEVYALSSFFTAIVFWLITKWERNAEEPHSLRWLILITYLIGLSIGVHLLNLLTIPAIAFLYYFKKYKVTRKGIIATAIISVLLIFGIMYVFIPGIVKYAGLFERFSVNTFDLPFHIGTVIYFLIIIGLIVFGLIYTRRYKKVIGNTIILSITFLLIGYSSFTMLVIRSNADPPIDENNPESALSLLAYLNREQYGDFPVFYGAYYNAPQDREDPTKDGMPRYEKFYLVKNGDRQVKKFSKEDSAKHFIAKSNKDYSIDHEYIMIYDAKGVKPNFDDRFKTIFPRMWSRRQRHESGYKEWSGFNGSNGIPIQITKRNGEKEVRHNPKFFAHNIRFFISYQVIHMYFRYMIWNLAGKQNDTQGRGGPIKGNWISGIDFLDEMRGNLGPQDYLPVKMKTHKARNTFYMLPLILGLIGFFYHLKVDKKNTLVVFLLFFMTGLGIIIYLNQYAYQPRERDYAYAGSLFAFAIWIGLGVMSLAKLLSKRLPLKLSGIITILVTLVAVPGILASEGWDDHDRSDRYTALAVAKNYLNSCRQNAILFTNGDNDTFPLWYAQEVEGIRTDVRVVNLSLLNTAWYADQMSRKAYESDPVPFSLTHDEYRKGTRDFVPIYEDPNLKDKYWNLKDIIDFVASDDPQTKLSTLQGNMNYFPTRKFKLPVDSAEVIDKGVVSPEDSNKIVDALKWKTSGNNIMKNHLLQLDLISNNDWERPIHFAITTGTSAYINLEKYFQLEGLTYRLVPIKDKSNDGQTGRVATEVMYDNMINEFEWGNMGKEGVFLDYTNRRMTMNFRNNFGRLAKALLKEGKHKKARNVCDKCLEILPDKKIPYNYFVIPVAEVYMEIGDTTKGAKIFNRIYEIYENDLSYYMNMEPEKRKSISREIQSGLSTLQKLRDVTRKYDMDELNRKVSEDFKRFYQQYARSQGKGTQRQRRQPRRRQQRSQGN